MTPRVLLIVAFFAVLVIASVMFGLLVLSPARLDLSAAGWIEWQQETIPWIRIPIIAAFVVSLASTVAVALMLRRSSSRASRWLFVVVGLLVVVVVITVAGELPLNDEIEAWSAERPPSDWEDVRNEWETLHALRGVAAASALAILYLAVPLPAGGAKT